MHWHNGFCILALTGVLAAGCSTPMFQRGPANDTPSPPFETSGLAGEWEVSDGAIEKTVVLDCQGTGQYGWQGGTVVTTVVRGNYWAGIWNQPGNDREGGFEVNLSDDHSKAEGRWWYSRIGEKRFVPGEQGDTFSMTRPLSARPVNDECRSRTFHEARGPY